MMFSLQSFHEEINRASNRFGLSFEALHSLFRNAHVIHMKRNSHSIRSLTMRHVKSYLNGSSLLNLARKYNYPPSMMARLIVENVATASSSSSTLNANHNMMKGVRGIVNVDDDGNNSRSSSSSNNNNINNSNNNATNRGGGGGSNSNITTKKFVTEALRHPEKMLGCASTSILPEYQFSENNGATGGERIIVDSFSQKPLHNDDDGNSSRLLSRLCLEVRGAIDSDPMYGPRQDKERHNVGIEYELLLEQILRSMDIPFETEAELRVRGTAKTPDVLLSCPVGIRTRRKESRNPLYAKSNEEDNSMRSSLAQKESVASVNLEDDDEYEWKVICWIDSKALFGDVETHTNSVLPQVETYVHRFGPGLVLYWFGHAPLSRLGDGHGDVAIVGGNVPDLMLMPTGEVHSQGGKRM